MAFKPGELIIMFRSGFTMDDIGKFLEERQMRLIATLPAMLDSITCLVRVTEGSEVEWTTELRKSRHPDVVSVGPNRLMEMA